MTMTPISAEAKAFLNAPSSHRPYELDPDAVAAWRAAVRADCAPLVEREISRLGVVPRDVEIGGVPCMEITPPTLKDRTILFCFGGGFVSGSAYEDLPISASLAVQCAARVIAPHYRLAPEHPYPAAVEDGMAVASALVDQEGPLAVVGESAGGNLALIIVAQMLRIRAEMPTMMAQMPKSMALLSPWCDLTNSGDSLSANEGRDLTLRADDVQRAAAVYAGSRPLSDPGVSPLFGQMAGLPPTILTTGTRDLLLSPTVQLAQALRDAGVTVDLRVWEQMWHVFEFYGLPESERSLAEIAAFLNRWW